MLPNQVVLNWIINNKENVNVDVDADPNKEERDRNVLYKYIPYHIPLNYVKRRKSVFSPGKADQELCYYRKIILCIRM